MSRLSKTMLISVLVVIGVVSLLSGAAFADKSAQPTEGTDQQAQIAELTDRVESLEGQIAALQAIATEDDIRLSNVNGAEHQDAG
ncbi:MAG: hypothetical protein OEU32_10915 [Acidimicrobiia bacterium]|nr:hypothetical protein [Acidimicrobiia bacterium]